MEFFLFDLMLIVSFSKIQDMSGWYLTDISDHIRVAPQRDNLDSPEISISNTQVRQSLPNSYYWSAPAAYLGNKVSASFSWLCFNGQVMSRGFVQYFTKERWCQTPSIVPELPSYTNLVLSPMLCVLAIDGLLSLGIPRTQLCPQTAGFLCRLFEWRS